MNDSNIKNDSNTKNDNEKIELIEEALLKNISGGRRNICEKDMCKIGKNDFCKMEICTYP